MLTPANVSTLLDEISAYLPRQISILDLGIFPEDGQNSAISIYFSTLNRAQDWSLNPLKTKAFCSLLGKDAKNLFNLGYIESLKDGGSRLTKKGQSAIKEAILFCFPNYTKPTRSGLEFTLPVPQRVISVARSLSRDHFLRKSPLGLEADCTGYENLGQVFLGPVEVEGQFSIIFNARKQICLKNEFNENSVTVIAKHRGKYYVFVAEYDADIELYAPIYYIGQISVVEASPLS